MVIFAGVFTFLALVYGTGTGIWKQPQVIGAIWLFWSLFLIVGGFLESLLPVRWTLDEEGFIRMPLLGGVKRVPFHDLVFFSIGESSQLPEKRWVLSLQDQAGVVGRLLVSGAITHGQIRIFLNGRVVERPRAE